MRSPRRGVAAAILMSAASPVSAAPVRAGIYGNVHYTQEAGDIVGMEIRVRPHPRPSIDFVLCEGECAPQVRLPIAMVPGGFAFTYRQALTDQDGRALPDALMHFTAAYRGRNLIVRMKGAPTEKLRPQRGPIALR